MRNWIKQFFSASEKAASESAIARPADVATLSRTDPDDADLKAQGDAHLRKGDFAAAVQCYRQAIAIKPDNAKTLNNLGFALNEQGLFAEAQSCLEQALAIDPTVADAHYLLGTVSQAQGKSDIACSHFRKALALAPDFEFAYRDLCFLLFQRGLFEEAKQVANQGIALNPHFADLHFYLGKLHHEQQRLDLAIANYHEALALQPNRPEILVNLGLVLLKQDDPNQAVEALRKALALDPNSAAICNLLGDALRLAGKSDEAIICYRQAIAIEADPADAHFNLGNALCASGNLDEAAASYRNALQIKSDFTEAHNNLGNVLQDLGQTAAAVACYRLAVQIAPVNAEVHDNLGNALHDLGQLEEAIACFRLALQIKPDFAGALSNLGNALKDFGQHDEAVACLRGALRIKPDYGEALSNLGSVLQDLGQLDEACGLLSPGTCAHARSAEACCNLASALIRGRAIRRRGGHLSSGAGNQAEFCQRLLQSRRSPDRTRKTRRCNSGCRAALAIKPDLIDASCNLSSALVDIGQFEVAAECCRKALKFAPDHAGIHNNLGLALTGLGCLIEAIASYRRALEIKPAYPEAHSNLLFTYNFLSAQSGIVALSEARRFGDLAARNAHPFTNWSNTPEIGRRLRVGLLSGDLRSHPVGFFVESILAALAANASGQLQMMVYSTNFLTDGVTEQIKATCHGWRCVAGLTDRSLAQLIRDDGIDILIDLSGHTAYNRLPMFAWKPAPVQVSWLGYFATTGVAAMDYLIADPWTLPQSEESNFTEKIWRMPETRLCFTAPDVDTQVAASPALANGYITFGCFNNLAKMNDAVVALWARILVAMPDSRLLLKAKQLGEASVRARTFERFAAQGIAADRLVLDSYSAREHYLKAYRQIDIALDPFPFTGVQPLPRLCGWASRSCLWPVKVLSRGKALAY